MTKHLEITIKEMSCSSATHLDWDTTLDFSNKYSDSTPKIKINNKLVNFHWPISWFRDWWLIDQLTNWLTHINQLKERWMNRNKETQRNYLTDCVTDGLMNGLASWLTGKLTDWQTCTQIDRLTDRQTGRHTYKQTDWLTDWQTDGHTDRQTDRQTDWQRDGQTDWVTDR